MRCVHGGSPHSSPCAGLHRAHGGVALSLFLCQATSWQSRRDSIASCVSRSAAAAPQRDSGETVRPLRWCGVKMRAERGIRALIKFLSVGCSVCLLAWRVLGVLVCCSGVHSSRWSDDQHGRGSRCQPRSVRHRLAVGIFSSTRGRARRGAHLAGIQALGERGDHMA